MKGSQPFTGPWLAGGQMGAKGWLESSGWEGQGEGADDALEEPVARVPCEDVVPDVPALPDDARVFAFGGVAVLVAGVPQAVARRQRTMRRGIARVICQPRFLTFTGRRPHTGRRSPFPCRARQPDERAPEP